ncbi:peptide-methionine (S)-S-oxide reductase [Sanyastnella coralliicola]|uniref:peptide-methionine (S)-S-oxide reductase n=1 Tax=Sanyastnella coralliicola TaxID=3069118 RepID=UPI0027BB1351|nr:peptide-methionine (S)-S-oxide reductase [Longitalea sp. SCSIO 12813]
MKIGFGGGCHWCTEAVFQHLKGVTEVEQGWIASHAPQDEYSEAVIVHFDPAIIPLNVLAEIHLRTHQSGVNHSMRHKYRSALYFFDEGDQGALLNAIAETDLGFEPVTQVLPFVSFKASREEIQNYYAKNPSKPFCERYIDPKLELLRSAYTKHFKPVDFVVDEPDSTVR